MRSATTFLLAAVVLAALGCMPFAVLSAFFAGVNLLVWLHQNKTLSQNWTIACFAILVLTTASGLGAVARF